MSQGNKKRKNRSQTQQEDQEEQTHDRAQGEVLQGEAGDL